MSTELAVSKLLEQYKGQFESALPRHMRIDHFMRCAMTYLKKNPSIGQCDPVSIAKSLMDAAQLGLAPDGLLGSAYLVPFGNQCQLIPGYRGLIDLARRSGEILDIQARPVLQGEDFSIDWGRNPPMTHRPNIDANPAEDQGANVRGVYAIAFFKDGSQHLEYMSRAEIMGIQGRSKAAAKGFSPWKTDWVEMARKTVVKRLAKYLPLSPELARAIELDNDAEVIKPADATVQDDKPASRTSELKSRLTHKPAAPVQEELKAASEAQTATATLDEPEPSGNGHAPAPTQSATAVAEPPKLEPDTLTKKDKIKVGTMANGKPMLRPANECDPEQLEEAITFAQADVDNPEATPEAKAHALGVIALCNRLKLEAPAKR